MSEDYGNDYGRVSESPAIAAVEPVTNEQDRSRSPRRSSFDRGYPSFRGGRRGGRRGGYRSREGRDGPPPPTRVYENSIFVGNLPYETSWQDLKDHFREAGDIVHADVLMARGRSKGMGTVEFASRDLAQRAIELFDRSTFEGREIFVREDLPPPNKDQGGRRGGEQRGGRFDRAERPQRERAPPPPVDGYEVFVGNLPYTTTDDEFKGLVADLDDVKSAEIRTDRRGKSKGFGIVIFATQDEADKAVESLDGREVNGRNLEVRHGRAAFSSDAPARPHNSEFTQGVTGRGAPSNTIFVDNLPWETSESDLYDLFGSIAKVDKAELQYDQIGRPAGSAVVRLADEEGATNAISQLDNYEYGNRSLRLSFALLPGAAPAAASAVAEPVAEAADEAMDTAPDAAEAAPEPQADVDQIEE